MSSDEIQQLKKLLERVTKYGIRQEPYKSSQIIAKALSTATTQIECDFIPDRVVIKNPAGGQIIHVTLSAAMDDTNYFAIDKGDMLDLPVNTKIISAKSAAGAPTIHVLFLAYEKRKG